MSRIGKAPIEIPAGVTVQVKDSVVTVKGPKGGTCSGDQSGHHSRTGRQPDRSEASERRA